jgi:hypothetical protein
MYWQDGAAPQRAVIPAHAGIQYAATFRPDQERLGILGRPVKPGDDGWGVAAPRCSTKSRHRPRMRGIQYAATFRPDQERLGILGRPVECSFRTDHSSSAMTVGVWQLRAAPQRAVIARACGGSSTPRPFDLIRNAWEYWVARSSRATTAMMYWQDGAAPQRAVIPAHAGIQYAATFRFDPGTPRNTGSPGRAGR